MFKRGVIFLFVLSVGWLVSGQIVDELPTNNTVNKRVNHRKYEPKRKTYSKLYKTSTKGTLYGNPCALEVTRKMGFEYVPLSQGHGKSTVGLILNNTYVNGKLIVTRSPFWKLILKKRLKNCRTKSGDGVG
jgi:hypothetical protein